MVKLPSSFDDFSMKQLQEKCGEPEPRPVTQYDGKPLLSNTPAKAVVPLFLKKYTEEYMSSNAHLLLDDFGEAFSPTSKVRLGQDCHTPSAFQAPEAKIESQIPRRYPSDI